MSETTFETTHAVITMRHGDRLISLPVDFDQRSGRRAWAVSIAPDGEGSVDRLLWLPEEASAHEAISALLAGIVEVAAQREAQLGAWLDQQSRSCRRRERPKGNEARTREDIQPPTETSGDAWTL